MKIFKKILSIAFVSIFVFSFFAPTIFAEKTVTRTGGATVISEELGASDFIPDKKSRTDKKGMSAARQSLGVTGGSIDPGYQQSTGRHTLYTMVGNILKTALGFLGTVLLIVIIIGGYMWFFAGGNEEKVTKARKWIFNGVIGFVIVASAWLLTSFIMQGLYQSATPSGDETSIRIK